MSSMIWFLLLASILHHQLYHIRSDDALLIAGRYGSLHEIVEEILDFVADHFQPQYSRQPMSVWKYLQKYGEHLQKYGIVEIGRFSSIHSIHCPAF